MGRYYFNTKQEANYLHKLSIYWLKKNNYLENGWWKTGGIKWTNGWTGKETIVNFNVSLEEANISHHIDLSYKREINGAEEDINYKITLTSTTCYFGGIRYWFVCPAIVNGINCGKRVGVLYLWGRYFACRHCYNLTYGSRNENRRFRNFSLFYGILGLKKLQEMEGKIKRRCYAGKPTRKQKALNKFYLKLSPFLNQIRLTNTK